MYMASGRLCNAFLPTHQPVIYCYLLYICISSHPSLHLIKCYLILSDSKCQRISIQCVVHLHLVLFTLGFVILLQSVRYVCITWFIHWYRHVVHKGIVQTCCTMSLIMQLVSVCCVYHMLCMNHVYHMLCITCVSHVSHHVYQWWSLCMNHVYHMLCITCVSHVSHHVYQSWSLCMNCVYHMLCMNRVYHMLCMNLVYHMLCMNRVYHMIHTIVQTCSWSVGVSHYSVPWFDTLLNSSFHLRT